MPKTAILDILPLTSNVQASLVTLGKRIVAARKQRKLTQRQLASMLEISPQTMLFVEQGRPTAQIGHYARALALLEASQPLTDNPKTAGPQPENVRVNLIRQHLAIAQQRAPYNQKLEFAYNWSNPNMPDDTLIRKVVDKGRFHDLAVICKQFGLERVRSLASKQISGSPPLQRAFQNIEQGFSYATAQSHSS